MVLSFDFRAFGSVKQADLVDQFIELRAILSLQHRDDIIFPLTAWIA